MDILMGYDLEFYVYVIIPIFIVLFFSYYIYVNHVYLRIFIGMNQDVLDNLDNENYHYEDIKKVNKNLEKKDEEIKSLY